MVTADEIRRLKGQRVTFRLAPEATGPPTLTGHIVGIIEAADGLVVTLEPDGPPPGRRITVHYHHILGVTRQ